MNFSLTRVETSISTLAIFTLVTILPQNALAFETKLAFAKQQALQATVRLDETIEADESDRLAGAVLAYPSIRTERGLRYEAPRPIRVAAPVALPTADGRVILAMTGEASFYSRAGCLGCSPALRMANGQPLDDNALTMAIGADKKHLVGRSARVTNLVNGQSTTVRITDTGGFYQAKYGNRVADLTIASKNAIGMQGGLGQVRVEVF